MYARGFEAFGKMEATPRATSKYSLAIIDDDRHCAKLTVATNGSMQHGGFKTQFRTYYVRQP